MPLILKSTLMKLNSGFKKTHNKRMQSGQQTATRFADRWCEALCDSKEKDMSKSIEFYTQKTIASWDEAAPIHGSINSLLADKVANQDFNNLNPYFNALVDTYGVRDKSVVQVCCNNGVDLLSPKE